MDFNVEVDIWSSGRQVQSLGTDKPGTSSVRPFQRDHLFGTGTCRQVVVSKVRGKAPYMERFGDLDYIQTPGHS